MVKKQNDNIVLDFGDDNEIEGGKLRGILKSINKGTKKLGVNNAFKQAENQAKKLAKNAQKEIKQAEKEAKKRATKDARKAKRVIKKNIKPVAKFVVEEALHEGTKQAVKGAFTAGKKIPIFGDVLEELDDEYDLEDKAVRGSQSLVKKHVTKRINKKIDGAGYNTKPLMSGEGFKKLVAEAQSEGRTDAKGKIVLESDGRPLIYFDGSQYEVRNTVRGKSFVSSGSPLRKGRGWRSSGGSFRSSGRGLFDEPNAKYAVDKTQLMGRFTNGHYKPGLVRESEDQSYRPSLYLKNGKFVNPQVIVMSGSGFLQ